uniref:non-specific serine/threonine protein kinase n=1 Tax=Populus alba TaxID=43335 RepID=A0A4U5Q440_POPAL|nr:putative LRR receptor-like serine/threonine-protein kinase RFK1 [Populus alba]
MFFSLRYAFLISILALSCLETERLAAAELPQDEVDALNLITKKLGASGWNFNADSCGEYLPRVRPTDPERNISCNCRTENNTCHIVSLKFKRFSLAGELPPELIQLHYLESIDLSYNYLNGSIPSEWASLQLKSISLLANRLSGNIPSYLGNFTSLTYLDLELNQFSGMIPHELGKLVNLKFLILSSNKLDGNLPMELSKLGNLTDFRINDNNFNGSIPDFVKNWKQLKRLEMVASGLEGPIPSSISALETLTDLRIADITSTDQSFPDLSNITGLTRLLLRGCNISGEIPLYIWEMSKLRILDLSFNKFRGKLPNAITTETLVFIFLSGNLLTGNIPMFRKGMTVDLSYNNFSEQSIGQPACQQKTDVTLNLFRSSSMGNDLGGACMDDLKCDKYWHSLYINCGGQNVQINGSTYEGDGAVSGGAGLFYQSADEWGLSSTGDFMDDNDFQNRAYTENVPSLNINELYQTARISPISLTYYRRCLENGNYTVSLHFAEIRFTNDNTFNSLGRRLFDIYIQNNLVEKDFNIEVQAAGAAKPVTEIHNATVTNNILEIRLFWAGKGTRRIPVSGVYGPLISAISVDPNFKPRFSRGEKTKTVPIIVGVVHNMSCGPGNQYSCLLDWACHLERNGNLIELVDRKLGSEFNRVEAQRMIKVALLCANASPLLRPIMSEVVSMLEGTRIIPEVIPEPISEDLRFKAIRGHQEQTRSLRERGKQTILDRSANSSSYVCTDDDIWETDTESNVRSNTRSKHHESPGQVSTSILPVTASSSTSVQDLFDIDINS